MRELKDNWWKNRKENIHIYIELDNPSLYYIGAIFPQVREEIEKYLNMGRIQVYLSGKDLKEMGISDGKIIGELKKVLLEEHWIGNLMTREDEINFIKKAYIKI